MKYVYRGPYESNLLLIRVNQDARGPLIDASSREPLVETIELQRSRDRS